ncbi:MAG: hypothetical protein PF450_12170 [Bacteroidales bacterium]|jgi:hypothetical protein|nr:hypothetical protein [Bacteroidales bacterium]
MKAIHTISIIAVFAAASIMVSAQDYPDEYLGLPGDNLNLYAVMNLFQESETLEAFERSLNDQETTVNNLDLNGDRFVDYITVSDFVDKEVHNIVLRTFLNDKDQQDIAVFVVEKLRNGEVQIQLIGDEALYGPNYIVEPIYAETPNPGYTGNTYSRNANVVTTTYHDIAVWPVVRYMYRPNYVVWRSSWYYGYYPSYWHSWNPHYYHYYYGYHSRWNDRYYSHYRHSDYYRSRSYNNYYHSHVRVYSPTVVVNIKNDRYRNTYSRPDSRSEGEAHYARTANTRPSTSKVGAASGRQGVTRTGTPSKSSRPSATSTQRSTNSRTSTSRASQDRSSSKSSSSSATRSSSSNNKSTPATSRSSSSRSSSPATSRSSSSRSSSSKSKSTPSTSRSSSSKSKSTPSTSRRSSSKSKSTPATTQSSRRSSRK